MSTYYFICDISCVNSKLNFYSIFSYLGKKLRKFQCNI